MIGHQRDIMATLGIDIWIPRDAVCEHNQSYLWRDSAQQENVSEIILPNTPAKVEPVVTPAKTPVQPQIKTVFEKNIPAVDVVVPATSSELPSVLQIGAFSIEAICLTHCVLLMDATTVTADQQLLWKNIQRAVQAEFHSLQWPFSWLNMQDGRGASSYVSGFLDAISTEKNILCLGQIPHLTSSAHIQLASLQEMVEQPLLKKRLWQFMQNKIKE